MIHLSFLKVWVFPLGLFKGKESEKWSSSVVSNSLQPVDCSLPGSSVHEILQARILEWIAVSFSRKSSWLRDQTLISCIDRWILYHWATWEAHMRSYWLAKLKNAGVRCQAWFVWNPVPFLSSLLGSLFCYVSILPQSGVPYTGKNIIIIQEAENRWYLLLLLLSRFNHVWLYATP